MKKVIPTSTEPRKSPARKLPLKYSKRTDVKAERPSAHTKPDSKLSTMIALLRRREGASVAELIKATGRQAHSIRGAISGTLKGKLGLNVSSELKDGVRRYCIS